jgi:hypothetical protein
VLEIDKKPPRTSWEFFDIEKCAINDKKKLLNHSGSLYRIKKCTKNRRKTSLNIPGLICRIETESRRPSSFKEYHLLSRVILKSD